MWNEEDSEEEMDHEMEADENEGSQRGGYGEEDSLSSGREGKCNGRGK